MGGGIEARPLRERALCRHVAGSRPAQVCVWLAGSIRHGDQAPLGSSRTLHGRDDTERALEEVWRDQLEFEELPDAGLRRPRGGELNMGN